MHKMFSAPSHVHWCCWLWVSPEVQISLEDFFLCRNQEDPEGSVGGFLGFGAGLDWAKLSHVLPGSRYSLSHCQGRYTIGIADPGCEKGG